jgi:acyl-CoA thioesterase
MTDKELLVKIFEKDGYVKLSGIELLEISNERAVACAKIGAEHLNANGSVQGGMLYTIADFAFAALANYLHPITVTQGATIDYVRAAYTSYITATAVEKVRVGKNTISEVTIRDEQDQVVCVCKFNGFVKEISKEELIKKFDK